jgi:hypothetical protein
MLAESPNVALERALVPQWIVVGAPERVRNGVTVEVALRRERERVEQAPQYESGRQVHAHVTVPNLVAPAVEHQRTVRFR